jgi:hypothetical protein
MTRPGHSSIVRAAALFAAAAFGLSACAGVQRSANPPVKVPGTEYVFLPEDEYDRASDRVTGEVGLRLFGPRNELDQGGGGGIGVNSFLWRASLDTISFMPLASADPFGGVIITDWYTPPDVPTERFKLTVYILDRRLRADGLRVALFRQKRNGNSEWLYTRINQSARRILEDAILTRARELRLSSEAAL